MTDPNRYDPLRLDNQLCFALYAATRAMTRAYREYLGPAGLTYPQYLVLTVLWERDGLTITEIGEHLMLDSGTLTPLLKRLEGMSVVNRKRGTKDEREVEIWLAPKGCELRDIALDARSNVMCKLGMTDPEIADLRKELLELIGKLTPSQADKDAMHYDEH